MVVSYYKPLCYIGLVTSFKRSTQQSATAADDVIVFYIPRPQTAKLFSTVFRDIYLEQYDLTYTYRYIYVKSWINLYDP